MIHHLESIAAASVTAATGILGGAMLAVGLPGASAGAWIGGIVGGALTLGAAAAAKEWAEKQISKLIELPTKGELFEKIDDVKNEVVKLNDFYMKELVPLRERVVKIEERHATIDRGAEHED